MSEGFDHFCGLIHNKTIKVINAAIHTPRPPENKDAEIPRIKDTIHRILYANDFLVLIKKIEAIPRIEA